MKLKDILRKLMLELLQQHLVHNSIPKGTSILIIEQAET